MELWKYSAAEAVEAVKKKQIKTRDLIKSVLTRCKEASALNSYITLRETEAIAESEAIDKSLEKGEAFSLAGLTLSLKDNLCWKNTPTTLGVKAMENLVPPFSSTPAFNLAEKGAIVIGKNNLDQWSMGNTTRSSSFGTTLNPWDNSCTAGDGSAAAVAAGGTSLALSTDTGGGLRRSAAYCGIYGLRPTPGRISRHGMVSFSPSFSQTGILARSLNDLSIALETISGFDPRDAMTKAYKHRTTPPQLKKEPVAVVPKELFQQTEENTREEYLRIVENLSQTGIKIEEISLPHFQYGVLAYHIISCAEASSQLARFDGIRYGQPVESSNLEDWYFKTRAQTLEGEARRRCVLGVYYLNEKHYEKYYKKALQVWSLIKKEFASALQGKEFLLLPTTNSLPPLLENHSGVVDNYQEDYFTAPVSLAGLPALNIPVSFASNLPLGIQLIASPYSEEILLEAAGKYWETLGQLPLEEV